MSFTQQRNKIETQINQVNSVEEYQKQYLSNSIVDWLTNLTGRYTIHLYNDLLKDETQKDLKSFLGPAYGASEEHSKNCITIAYVTGHLFGSKVKDWTNSALPAFDNFLLQLIHVVLGEKVTKRGKRIYETDVYNHLIAKGGDLAEIGVAFQSIYQTRSSFMHVQVEDGAGNRKQILWGSKRYKLAKESIIEQFNKAIKILDKFIQ